MATEEERNSSLAKWSGHMGADLNNTTLSYLGLNTLLGHTGTSDGSTQIHCDLWNWMHEDLEWRCTNGH